MKKTKRKNHPLEMHRKKTKDHNSRYADKKLFLGGRRWKRTGIETSWGIPSAQSGSKPDYIYSQHTHSHLLTSHLRLPQTKQIGAKRHGARGGREHELPPAILACAIGILVSQPGPDSRDASQDGGKSIPVSLAGEALTAAQPLSLVLGGGDGCDEEGPDGIDGGVQGSMDGQRAQRSVEFIRERDDEWVEACESGRVSM